MLRANEVSTAAVYRRTLWEQAGGFHDAGTGETYVFEDWSSGSEWLVSAPG